MPKASEPYRPDLPIVPELAAGAIVVRGGGPGREVLLLHQTAEDRWCFPKGHVEKGESLEDAATREVREETGLKDVHLDGELGEVSYRFFSPKKGTNIHKTTVYFLASTRDVRVHPERLFDRGEWTTVASALERVKYDTDRQVLGLLEGRFGDRADAPRSNP